MTLKANELRIGNYLNGKQGHVIITQIKENNIVKIHDNTSIFYVGTCLKPIPLTEEWFLKFGFECVFTNDDHHYYLESIDLSLDRSYQPFGIGEYKLKFEYVHQLQNLYFALTGEELTLKNNSNN